MNRKKIMTILSCILIVLITSMTIDNKINTNTTNALEKEAGETWGASGTCSESIPSSGQWPTSSCTTDMCNKNDGMCSCVADEYSVSGSIKYEDTAESVRKKRIIFSDIGRIDAWGSNYGGGTLWKPISQVSGINVCPGMTNLIFSRTEDIPEEILKHDDGNGSLVLVEGKKPNDFSNYTQANDALGDWSVENYTITAYRDSNIKRYVFTANIPKLSTNNGGSYGMSGITRFHTNSISNGTYYSSNTRAYHYYLPYQIVFEYDACKGYGSDEFAKNNPGVCCDTYPETCQEVNPCIGDNSQEYAESNLGVCCYEYPETCCNTTTLSDGTKWIGSSNNDGIWLDYYKNYENGWRANRCCSDITFSHKNPDKCKSDINLIPFAKTEKHNCPSAYNPEYFYTTSYIQVTNDGKVIDSSATCSLSGNGACSTPITYTYTISVNKNMDPNITLDDIGHSYFNNSNTSDYEEYLKQREKGSVTEVGNEEGHGIDPNKNTFRSNSLNSSNFNYKVSNPRIDPSNNDKYLIDITVTVYNIGKTDSNLQVPYNYNGTKVYFVPIKLSLCWNRSGGENNNNNNDNTCTNMSYAKEHLSECCLDDKFSKNNKLLCPSYSCDPSDPSCNPPDNPEISYSLEMNTSCENGTKVTSPFTKEDGNIKITESINLSTPKSPTVISGTGFEFDLGVTNTVVYEMDTGTTYSSYNALTNALNGFVSSVNSLNQSFQNRNLYNSQTIKFNADGKTIPYSGINNLEFNNISSSTSLLYYKNNTNYVCAELTSVGDRTKVYLWHNENFPGNYITLPSTDSYGGSLSPCWSGYIGRTPTYSVSRTTSYKYEYKYSTKLSNAYINKLDAINGITYDNKSSDFNYINGGNKFYTKITDETGYYPFNITIQNGGVTGIVNTSTTTNTAYTCNYRVLNCAIEGVCPPTSCTDPTCINEEDPEPTNGTSNHYFRPISLTNPFPNNRVAGPNWSTYGNNNNYKYISTHDNGSEKGESIYTQQPMYEITLTNDMINQIKKFNKANPDYSNFNTMKSIATNSEEGNSGICKLGLCRQSLFLNYLSYGGYNDLTLGGMDISGQPLKFNNLINRFYRIGDFGTLGGGS